MIPEEEDRLVDFDLFSVSLQEFLESQNGKALYQVFDDIVRIAFSSGYRAAGGQSPMPPTFPDWEDD